MAGLPVEQVGRQIGQVRVLQRNRLGERLMSVPLSVEHRQSFERWTRGRLLPSVGTNAGTGPIAFQGWKNFKEAFAPELILRAVTESPIKVRHILDPFGGSGTTSLASRFLGVSCTTIEINPFLADLIKAKVDSYSIDELCEDWRRLRTNLRSRHGASVTADKLPPTFVEPGVNDRWLYSTEAFSAISSIMGAIELVEEVRHQRLFKVLLGGILVSVSNIRVAGKGRRYRSNWRDRQTDSHSVYEEYEQAVGSAIRDITAHNFDGDSPTVIQGDSRSALPSTRDAELVIFSPPYPNSFDYTDVYNVELWVLGYLRSWDENRQLRSSTLSSHVQIKREFGSAPSGSPLLDGVLRDLRLREEDLWDKALPDMVGAYFAELSSIIAASAAQLTLGGRIWIVVGDSRYAGINIKVAQILAELAVTRGLRLVSMEPFRSMRVSPQQGGAEGLDESLLILERVDHAVAGASI